MIAWSIQKVNIRSLKKHPKNPRTISRTQVEHLQSSLDKFGLIEKPILNADMMILSGHQRVTLLKKQGIKEIECWMPNRQLDEKEAEELLLKMNRVHGDFNYEILANEFSVPDLLDFGFTVEELELKEIDDIESEDEPKKKEKHCPHCQGIL